MKTLESGNWAYIVKKSWKLLSRATDAFLIKEIIAGGEARNMQESSLGNMNL